MSGGFLFYPFVPHSPYSSQMAVFTVFAKFSTYPADMLGYYGTVALGVIAPYLLVYPFLVENLTCVKGQQLDNAVFLFGKVKLFILAGNSLFGVVHHGITEESDI